MSPKAQPESTRELSSIPKLLSRRKIVRTAFLIDGFNLYHSVDAAAHALKSQSTKWLDLKAFCSSYLAPIGNRAVLGPVHYFSALAIHLEARKPDYQFYRPVNVASTESASKGKPVVAAPVRPL